MNKTEYTLVVPIWEPGYFEHFNVHTDDLAEAVEYAKKGVIVGDYDWNGAVLYEGEV